MSTAAPLPDPVSCGNVPLPTLEQLPDDAATLKRMILELLVTLHQQRQDEAELRQRINLLLRRLYGPRSERVDADQLLLFAEGTAASAATADDAAESAEDDAAASSSRKRRRGKPHGRQQLPADLPRHPVHHELSDAERRCPCGEMRIDIGAELSEQLDWRPASCMVTQHHVHKYLCPVCARRALEQTSQPSVAADPTPPGAGETSPTPSPSAVSGPLLGEVLVPPGSIAVAGPGPAIVSARKPAMPIDKGLAGPGLLAYLIVSKYFDHL